MSTQLNFSVPSRGRIGEQTNSFLISCGLSIARPNPKQYTATIPAVPGITVHMLRSADIVGQVSAGNADIGITGLDDLKERQREGDDIILILDDLGFSRARLVLAVPEGWIDVSNMNDLAEIALEFGDSSRNLRVATSYPVLTREFLTKHRIHNFTLVETAGAVEAAPGMGAADVIVDISETGTSLKENRLVPLPDGIVIQSSACLIGNSSQLSKSPEKRSMLRPALEFIEGHLSGQDLHTITANVRGSSDATVAENVLANASVAGILGPTISRVAPPESSGSSGWFSVSVTVPRNLLLAAVDHLRSIGATSIVARDADYVFDETSCTYQTLLSTLGVEE